MSLIYFSFCAAVHYWLELGVSIQQHDVSIKGFQDIEMRLPKLFNANFTGKMMEFR